MTVFAPRNSADIVECSANVHAPRGLPDGAPTITEVLLDRAARQGDEIALVHLGLDAAPDEIRTFADLDRAAGRIARRLLDWMAPSAGEGVNRFVLAYPPCIDFAEAYFGTLYSGAEAVNVFAPETPREAAKLQAIVADCNPCAVLTHSSTEQLVRTALDDAGLFAVPLLATDRMVGADGDARHVAPPDARSPTCFIQYTSGSTGAPKGVMVRHANLLHNLAVIDHNLRGSDAGRYLGLSWLPVFHDMGFVAGLNYPIFIGRPHLILSHKAFGQRPQRWLEQLSRFGATHTAGPNFAFDRGAKVARRIDKSALDLSRVRFALCGAEPIRAATLERFAAEYAGCGFSAAALAPAYGLAEATLMVSGTQPGGGMRVVHADRAMLGKGRFVPARPVEDADGLGAGAVVALVSSGAICPLLDVRIVDPTTLTPVGPRQAGEIWVAGGSVSAGYSGGGEADARTFGATLAGSDARYLRTGDLGFVDGDDLFITGRLKDLIIVNGVNHHPQDIEAAIDELEIAFIRRSAAFPVSDGRGAEALAVLCEIRAPQPEQDFAQAAQRIVNALYRSQGLAVSQLAFARKGAISVTSSGKVQRSLARQNYEETRLDVAYNYRALIRA